MRDPFVLEWRRNPAGPILPLGLSVVVGILMVVSPVGSGAMVGLAATEALKRWVSSPAREASDEFLLVRGIVSRQGLALRRLVVGLLPIGAALAIAAALQAGGTARSEHAPSLGAFALAGIDTCLFTAALIRTAALPVAIAPLSVVPTGITLLALLVWSDTRIGEGLLWLVTLAGAPLALMALLRTPKGERSAPPVSSVERRDTPVERGERPPSGPLRALIRAALLPYLGRDTLTTLALCGLWLGTIGTLIPTLRPETTAKSFASWSYLVGLWLGLLTFAPTTAAGVGAWWQPEAARGRLEWVLARPLSRRTLAAAYGAALHLALFLVVASAFGAAYALTVYLGLPVPLPINAAALMTLASVQLGIAAACTLGSARGLGAPSSRRAAILILTVVLAVPFLFALPMLDRWLRGDAASLSPWMVETMGPWILAHGSLAILALASAAVLAHALAYRRFRSFEL